MKKIARNTLLLLILCVLGSSIKAQAGGGQNSGNSLVVKLHDTLGWQVVLETQANPAGNPVAEGLEIAPNTSIGYRQMGLTDNVGKLYVHIDGALKDGNSATGDAWTKVNKVTKSGPTLQNGNLLTTYDIFLVTITGGPVSSPKESGSHTHSYEWETMVEPTTECDGEEAYVCSCGDVEMKQPLSAALYTLRLNEKAIKNAKAGATVVVDVKRFNSLPKWFVEKLVERDDVEITLKFTYNHDNYALNVPKTATIEDESIAWYGPLKLLSMFPQK